MKKGSTKQLIKEIILNKRWLDQVVDVVFLAAGEYNENYLVDSGEMKYVFRINHGSQIDQDDQISYEHHVLKKVAPSGVTPEPYHVASNTRLGGVLLMAYISGRGFDFNRDLTKVPPVFAAVHSLPILPSNSKFSGQNEHTLPPILCQIDPIADIAKESHGLIHRFPNHPLEKEKKLLTKYHDTVLALREQHKTLFDKEALCLVNTEVNSGNFIVNGDRAFLVDWEKAVISCRYQDLAHFIIPTTTLWKSDFTFTPDGRIDFLKRYFQLLSPDFSFEELEFKTAILEKTILLRALSWCFMAWYEYTGRDGGKRALTDTTTFKKISTYLEHIECFLK